MTPTVLHMQKKHYEKKGRNFCGKNVNVAMKSRTDASMRRYHIRGEEVPCRITRKARNEEKQEGAGNAL